MRARLRMLTVTVGVWLCGLTVASVYAADRTDPSFAEGGFAVTKPPEGFDTGPVAPNVWDLASVPDGGFVGALADLTRTPDYWGLVRYDEDGSLATDFGEGGFTRPLDPPGYARAQAQAVAVQPDGRIVVAGYRQISTGPSPLLVGYRLDGSVDPSFGEGGTVSQRFSRRRTEALHDLAIGPDGRLIAVGSVDEHEIGLSGKHPAGFVVAYKPDGELDRSFGKGGRVVFPAPGDGREYTGLKEVEVLPDGRLLVAGYHFGSIFLARLLPDGRLDRSFGGGKGRVTRFVGSRRYGCFRICWSASPLAIRPDGRIVVLAAVSPDLPVLLRFRPNGRLDRGFGRRGMVKVRARGVDLQPFDLALQGSGIVLAGFDESGRGDAPLAFSVFRYLGNGRLDRDFGEEGIVRRPTGSYSGAFAILEQPDDRLVVAGGGQEKAEGARYYESYLLLTRYLAG